MNDLINNVKDINNDELVTAIHSAIRGTDLNGNYLFEAYDPKSPVTTNEKDYRIAKIMYKMNKKTGKIAGSNSCLIIPSMNETNVMNSLGSLMPHFCSYLEAEQDKIIKELHLKKVNFVTKESISLAKIVEFLEAERVSGRINKELIETWFTTNLQDNLIILFADKLGLDVARYEDVTSKLFMTVQVYKNLFSKLASNTISYQKPEAEKLLQAIEVCEVDGSDLVTIKIKEKLDKMINPINTMELLGF